jgi:hypothetical protein
VYYGYPTAKTPLKKGNVVILNIPIFSLNSGYNFVELKEFDSLIELLKINDANTLRIEINNFIGIDSSVCEFISNHLCNNIKEILSSKTTLKNYYIISNGSKNPISCKKEDTWVYIYLNSRIEIIVE